jgi:hypothetical protein
VIEYGLAEGIDTAQQHEVGVARTCYDSVEDDPFTAFAEIIFELHYQRHREPSLEVLAAM